MTGGGESWGGFLPPFSSLFCLVLISNLSIYLLYLLFYLSVHYHFLTTCRDKFYLTPLERRDRTDNKTSIRKCTRRRCQDKKARRLVVTRKARRKRALEELQTLCLQSWLMFLKQVQWRIRRVLVTLGLRI